MSSCAAINSHSLGEFPHAVVRIECERCDRAGSYHKDGLVARLTADIALAQSERRQDFSRPCGARYTDLAASAADRG
jgi:hypothetical protein